MEVRAGRRASVFSSVTMLHSEHSTELCVQQQAELLWSPVSLLLAGVSPDVAAGCLSLLCAQVLQTQSCFQKLGKHQVISRAL